MKFTFFPLILFLLLSLASYAQVVNKGVGGNSTKQLLARVDTDVIHENPDIVILMVGTNDFLNSKKMISFNEYEDNLNTIVGKIKTAGSKVILLSPPPVDSAYLFMRHEKSMYKQPPNMMLDSVSQILRNVAKDQSTMFLDLYGKFSSLGLPRHNKDLFIRNEKNSGVSDGVHPTALGYHLIAEYVFQFMKENELINEKMKIVCFGDSITKGSGSSRAGTVTGDNYPSFLSNRISNYLEKNYE